ncbi:hypothetical protein ABZP36_022598 [Zizania latifolia]
MRPPSLLTVASDPEDPEPEDIFHLGMAGEGDGYAAAIFGGHCDHRRCSWRKRLAGSHRRSTDPRIMGANRTRGHRRVGGGRLRRTSWPRARAP